MIIKGIFLVSGMVLLALLAALSADEIAALFYTGDTGVTFADSSGQRAPSLDGAAAESRDSGNSGIADSEIHYPENTSDRTAASASNMTSTTPGSRATDAGVSSAGGDGTITPYSIGELDHHPLDLEISDQDESYRDGVGATWVATANPGDDFDLSNSFIGLIITPESANVGENHTEIMVRYLVTEEIPCIESDTDCFTDQHPDAMAKELIIIRCTYSQTGSCIDCVTGRRYTGYDVNNHVCFGLQTGQNNDWKIGDFDGDGKTSFYDMKKHVLDNLPPAPALPGAQFEIGAKFDDDAGNDFQGDIFNFTVAFTVNQDESQ